MKHHYIPQFLLEQWAVNEGRLWRFLQPIPGKIAAKLVAPAEVGYERHLYATPGLPDDKIQQVEQRFMSRLDSLAAEAHRFLLEGRSRGMPQRERSSWSRFVMSLWFRTPAGLQYFKEAMGLLLTARDEALNARYRELKKEGYPDTLEEIIAMMGPDFPEQAAMDLLRKLTDDPKNGLRMNNMRWAALDTGNAELLITDAALQQSGAGIFSPQGFFTLPIAPDRLFVAASDPAILGQIAAIPMRDLVDQINRAVVRRASIFVGATTRAHETYVKEHFGQEDDRTMVKGLAERYREGADAMGAIPTA